VSGDDPCADIERWTTKANSLRNNRAPLPRVIGASAIPELAGTNIRGNPSLPDEAEL
jgi:hypothetical protein